jgi:diadenylate cyclase
VNALEKHMSPRGYRMLRKIPRLGDPVVDALICRFGSVRSMFDATVEELAAVDGVDPVRANDIREGLARLRELNLLERYG